MQYIEFIDAINNARASLDSHVSYLLHRAGPPNVEGNDQPPVVLSKLEL